MKAKKVLFVIFSAPIFLLMIAVLELNKNTVWGFIFVAVITAGFYTAHRLIIKKQDKWYLTLASWLGWLLLFVGVLFLT